MTTLTSPLVRFFAAAAMVLLLSLAVSSGAQAQPCVCDVVSVDVDPGVLCTIELHPSSPLCKFRPIFAPPGVSTPIACCDDMFVSIVTCDGTDVTFQIGAPKPVCIRGIRIAPGCCVDACMVEDAKGCTHIIIRPSSVKCVSC
jgi:hypothetical protein